MHSTFVQTMVDTLINKRNISVRLFIIQFSLYFKKINILLNIGLFPFFNTVDINDISLRFFLVNVDRNCKF